MKSREFTNHRNLESIFGDKTADRDLPFPLTILTGNECPWRRKLQPGAKYSYFSQSLNILEIDSGKV